ncbi:fluoride efflux transporter CrcB [Ornithinibacillus sp. BX22]|uniref:Fluoride-specific ion channel FluC n=2 Tax=Ornithinibacillus TaxID=484508 RepID=A0A923RJT3_9BACI|nr:MULTISPECIES: fluoride efflux transporter CrcB [Ornithinibacillus]MBC5638255.1 fluoride efflux transporter CrcB [Ornithinibacillus hominis]MBS3682116.1 fluoride efflux transporter CrcB [Ornithinibacillus massiliensis]
MNIMFICLGGFIGSILRFYISQKLNKRLIGTWIANITGSILLAITIYFYSIHVLTEALWSLLGIGFCGAYTTFSTFGNEVIQLLLSKNYKTAVAYSLTSLLITILAVFITLFVLGYQL